jgi:hypothetical protein
MSKKTTPTDLSSSDPNDETSSSEGQRRKSSRRTNKKDSIKHYVTDLLTKQEDEHFDLTKTEMKIQTSPENFPYYQNMSAFRRYQSTTDRTDSQQQHSSSSDDELKDRTPSEQVKRYKFENLVFLCILDSGIRRFTCRIKFRS